MTLPEAEKLYLIIILALISIFVFLNLILNIKIMNELQALQSAVDNETTVDQSAITLLQGLKAALDAAGTDPAKLTALSNAIGQNSANLAAAVAANTIAAPVLES